MPAKICLLALLSVLPTGCVHVRNAIHNTLADTLDIVRFDLSFSFGTDMGAHIMATKFAQLKSYSYEDLYRVGVGTRSAGVWEEERQGWWVGPLHSRTFRFNRSDVAAVTVALPAKMKSGQDAVFQFAAESRDEFGVGFHAFVLGARAGVRPLELLDFLANFVGLDLSGDNFSIRERQALEAAKRATERATERAAAETDEKAKPDSEAPDTPES